MFIYTEQVNNLINSLTKFLPKWDKPTLAHKIFKLKYSHYSAYRVWTDWMSTWAWEHHHEAFCFIVAIVVINSLCL